MGRLTLVALLALSTASAGCLSGILSPPTGEPIDFSVTSTDGRNLTDERYRGKVLVLDMMATWCGPCIEGMPHLREFHAEHADDVALLSLDVDPSEKAANDDPLPRFKEKHDGTWDFAYDTDRVFQRSGARIIPTLVIVDADGIVRERITEYPLTAEGLSKRVAPYLDGGG